MEVEGNYDESKVGEYILPAIWTDPPRQIAARVAAWPQRRREILAQFETVLYGRFPRDDFRVSTECFEEGWMIPHRARRRQYRLRFTHPRSGAFRSLELLLVLPVSAGPAPCFCALNFWGNHATSRCPEIPLNPNWMRHHEEWFPEHRSTEQSRGCVAHRWPYDLITDAGFAVATAYYGDIYPDHEGGRREGLAGLFDEPDDDSSSGAIGYWAWGLCAIRKFLAGLPEIQPQRIYAAGHSRLGKTALWAAANDEHFAGAVSNDSGCCGAKLTRRNFGEWPGFMAKVVPYWFCPAFPRWAGNPHDWPVDQHMLLATLAPRPFVVNSAMEDGWADPRGEELSAIHASALYAFLEGKLDAPVSDGSGILSPRVCYHLRPGPHDMLPPDWMAAIKHFSSCHSGGR